MATLRNATRTLLENDAALKLLLTGGIMDASELPLDGGGSSSVPLDTNGVTAKPFAVLRWGDENETSYAVLEAEDQALEVYVFGAIGYAVIDSAISRIKRLLNRQILYPDDREMASFHYVYASREMAADEFGGLPARFMRFIITHIRK